MQAHPNNLVQEGSRFDQCKSLWIANKLEIPADFEAPARNEAEDNEKKFCFKHLKRVLLCYSSA